MSEARFKTPDIAAVDGEAPDLLPVLISRESVEAMTYEPLLSRLRALSAERETVLRMRGRVVLAVHGYDDDPRPLSVIPEYERFAVGMLERWPEMAWYLLLLDDLPDGLTAESPEAWRPHADGAALPWLLGDTCTPVASGRMAVVSLLNARQYDLLDRRWTLALDGVAALAGRHRLPFEVVTARGNALRRLKPW